MVGTTTEHGGTQSLARMNLGHEPEVLREIIRAETMKTAIMYCIQTAEDIVKLISRPDSPMTLVFTPSVDTQFQGKPLQCDRKIHEGWNGTR